MNIFLNIPAYAPSEVSANNLFKEILYLLGQALSRVVTNSTTFYGMKIKKSIGGM